MADAHQGSILFFVPDRAASSDGILHSQVLGMARALSRRQYRCMFIGSEVDHEAVTAAQQLAAMQEMDAVRICAQDSYSRSYWTHRKWTQTAFRACRGEVVKWKPDVVYSRSPLAWPLARRIAEDCNAGTVCDLRGLISAEIRYRGHGHSAVNRLRRALTASLFDWTVSRNLRRADRVMCVSSMLRRWISEHAKRSDAHIVPCCADMNEFRHDAHARGRIRSQLEWPQDSPVVVYAGSTGRWQRIDDVVRLLVALRSRLPELRALFLTRDIERIEHKLKTAGFIPGRFAVRSVLHHEMPQWLSAADAGIILRHSDPVNYAASPVKMAEYLAVGLPIICSRAIGDLSNLVIEEGVGTYADDLCEESVQNVLHLLQDAAGGKCRTLAQRVARQYLTWSAHIETLEAVFTV